MSDTAEIALGDLSRPDSFFETLKAERECWDTYLYYFDIIDKKKPAELAGRCFTKDADIAYDMKGMPLVFHGRSEYAAFLEQAMAAQEMTAHVVGQHRFVWTDGKPRLLTSVTSWQWFVVNEHLGDTRPAEFVTIGYSEDDFDYVDGTWLIGRRIVRPAAGLVAIGAPPPVG
ncbi:nuclear transport factor 2 family protein [Amycolatopsis pigmentata]|uniref:Nuclear transport factor 2 family protein n=2 Tax=Amycolatopsis pigmentata TaxID=450801 RepID=A0ABW5FQH9_9PSEU